MKNKAKILSTLIILAVSVLMFAACSGDAATPTAKEHMSYVKSVTLSFNHLEIVDKSVEVYLDSTDEAFSANVVTYGDISPAYKIESSNVEVAEVGGGGALTPKAAGETLITAKSVIDPGKSDTVLLRVIDRTQTPTPDSFAVTVVGGKTDKATAKSGEIVTLSAYLREGHVFTGWVFDNDEVWVNGNIFEMPDGDITVTAEYDVLSYLLTLDGAAFTDETTVKEVNYGEPLPEVVYDEGEEMFVGFTNAEIPNELWYSNFTMPAKDITLKATFAAKISYTLSTNVDYGSGTVFADYPQSTEVGGISGLSYKIPSGWAEGSRMRIRGSSINGGINQVLRLSMKNAGTASISFSYSVDYYGNVGGTEVINLAADESVTVSFYVRSHRTDGGSSYHIIDIFGDVTADTPLVLYGCYFAPTPVPAVV